MEPERPPFCTGEPDRCELCVRTCVCVYVIHVCVHIYHGALCLCTYVRRCLCVYMHSTGV